MTNNTIRSKPIPNFENYLVYDNGTIYNQKKSKFQTIRIIPSGKHYKVIVISYKGKAAQIYVHKLVAEQFVENPNNLSQVRFKDGNSMNCDYTNLVWTTHSEACQKGNTGLKEKIKEGT